MSAPVITAPGGLALGSDAPEYAALRARRRRRVFDAMAAADLDVLVLGRPAEVTCATGLRQLWLAGSRPFGPAAILIAATGGVHLLATSEDGVPDELGAGSLFAMSWNPAKIHAAVAGLPGMAAAQRIGTTSFSPGFDKFLDSIAPGVDIVDGAGVLDAARRIKDAEEVACIEAATALAADALHTMCREVRPGITERELLAVYLGRLGELGVPTPPTEGVVCAIRPGEQARLRRLAGEGVIATGDRVVLDVAANVAGYEGGVGTTVIVDDVEPDALSRSDPLGRRAGAALAALVRSCRPGTTGADLRAVAYSAGSALGDEPVLVGMGMGVEPPVVTADIGGATVLEDGMVVAVSPWVADETGGWFERRLVHVGAAPRILGPIGLVAEEQHRGGAP